VGAVLVVGGALCWTRRNVEKGDQSVP